MKPNPRFQGLGPEFWAHVRSISQQVGYTEVRPGYLAVPPGLKTPSSFKKHGGPRRNVVRAIGLADMQLALDGLGLDHSHLATESGSRSPMGKLLCDYFAYRAKVLNHRVEPVLMDAARARKLYLASKSKYRPKREAVMNKQKGIKRSEAYLTCLVNMVFEYYVKELPCNFDPLELTTITRDGRPYRTLARRVDGTFPGPVNPIAVWEIKEYYYTTTFGSRIADGIYETLLDGMEIEEARVDSGIDVKHYLMVDSHFTWWGCGKSYLCRIVDMLHMGFVDEVLFGEEVATELPRIVKKLVAEARRRKVAATSKR
jgi:hypothetical protein